MLFIRIQKLCLLIERGLPYTMSSWADNLNGAYFNRKLERQHCQDLHLKGGKAENLMFG